MRKLAEQLKYGNVYTATVTTGEHMGEVSFAEERMAFPNMPQTLPAVHDGVLYEHMIRHRPLILCGGGHVSRPVCALGAMLGYEVTVIDDRPEFANRERFPQAKDIRCASFETALENTPENAAYVIITRGHQADALCLSKILNKRFSYCGMIGSKTKSAAVMKQMREQGFSEQLLAQVHSPIGLKIGAHTPEEIAVSIAAELIQVHSAQNSSILPEDVFKQLQSCPDAMVMAVIIRRDGSAPRGVGARMLICADGDVFGTIGGGSVEHEAIQYAKHMMGQTTAEMQTYVVGGGEAANLGMICGGAVDVLFLPIAPETGENT